MLLSPSRATLAPWGHCKVTAQHTGSRLQPAQPGTAAHEAAGWFSLKTKFLSLAHILQPTLPHTPRGVRWSPFAEELSDSLFAACPLFQPV